ncbi:MAG: hypothetical protein ACYC7H_10320, partial [Chloroflexota bacterium]
MASRISDRDQHESSRLYLGLDIGSVNARAAVVDAAGAVVLLDVERIYKGPATAVATLLDRLRAQVN